MVTSSLPWTCSNSLEALRKPLATGSRSPLLLGASSKVSIAPCLPSILKLNPMHWEGKGHKFGCRSESGGWVHRPTSLRGNKDGEALKKLRMNGVGKMETRSGSGKKGLLICYASSEPSAYSSNGFKISRLEAYTEKFKREVLRVRAEIEDEEDEVIVFKGFSSSLMRSTSVDPSEPVLPPNAKVVSIDRILGPYNPSNVQVIQEGLTWEEFDSILKDNRL